MARTASPHTSLWHTALTNFRTKVRQAGEKRFGRRLLKRQVDGLCWQVLAILTYGTEIDDVIERTLSRVMLPDMHMPPLAAESTIRNPQSAMTEPVHAR